MDVRIGDWTKLGAAIRDARKSRALSQAALADRAGVSRSWLARLETGHRGAELAPVFRLLEALELTLSLRDSNAAVSRTEAPADAASPIPAEPRQIAERGRPSGFGQQIAALATEDQRTSLVAAQRSRSAALARKATTGTSPSLSMPTPSPAQSEASTISKVTGAAGLAAVAKHQLTAAERRRAWGEAATLAARAKERARIDSGQMTSQAGETPGSDQKDTE